jgi:hypothetical protein
VYILKIKAEESHLGSGQRTNADGTVLLYPALPELSSGTLHLSEAVIWFFLLN